MGLARYILRQEDFTRLVEAPYLLRDRCIMRLLYVTGVRSRELCTIQVKDVDLENRTIRILDSKKKRYFTLPIDSKTCKLLKEYISTINSRWLFPSISTKKSKTGHLTKDGLLYIVKFYAKAIGLDPDEWYPRQFRRRIARYWIKNKGSLIGLQQLLRHKNFVTTAIYVDSIRFEDELREEYDKIMEGSS